MDNLPELPLFEILIKLRPLDLRSICLSNKKIYQFINGNEYFWQSKIPYDTSIKYYPSWYLTYKNITSLIPVYINIDNSNIYGEWSHFTDESKKIYFDYNSQPDLYIDRKRREKFGSIRNRVHEYCQKLIPSHFIVMYFNRDIVLAVSKGDQYTIYRAGMIPDKILVFNDQALCSNYYTCCIDNFSLQINNNMEYSREVYRMLCKSMIQQYPNINLYKLIYALDDGNDFELELEL